ncbi:GNAT family N-acetyltransferase [Streptomyces sp. NBC_01537]|uniref:GNAT family N-acetyltransferase n=1 Tax=Streptomyces sp. NBC_01537 TaxID=2903896 RepID=UPI003864B25A
MIITSARPEDLARLLAFREEAAAWLALLGTDQWGRPYPADRLLAAVRRGTVFMVRDGDVTAATITVTPDAGEGLWTAAEASEPAKYVSKLTVARTHAGQNLGGRLLDWAGDRAYRASAKWLRLDAWTTNRRLQDYYLSQGFRHVRTVREGEALYGGPRVSGWLAQREARPVRPGDLGLVDGTPDVKPSVSEDSEL